MQPFLVIYAALTVLPPRTVNLTEGETAAVAEIFASVLQEEGADGQVEWSLVRLESHIVVRAHMSGRSVEMTATSLDDLPTVARRVARALTTGDGPAATRTPENVTSLETQVPNRTYTERAGGLFLMPVIPFAVGQRVEPAIAFGVDLRLDKGGYFYEVDAGMLLPTGSSEHPSVGGVFADLGAAVHLSDGNFTPYVGGGMSTRIIGGFGDAIVGLAPYGHLGIVFDRSSSARFYVELRVAQNLIPLTKHDDDVYLASGAVEDGGEKRIFLTEAGARLGLLF
jgi:hypothetical protein